ncbi:MAG: hypothetical protein Kow0074_11400 [Candidatus Zixiibacteriota bacterium]
MNTVRSQLDSASADWQAPLTLEHIVPSLGSYPLAQTQLIPVIMRMTANLETEVEDLTRILSTDPALSAKVVQLANSPFYGSRHTITSLHQAIQILGFATVRSLAVAASAYGLFRKEETEGTEQELWRHSLAVGLASRLVARRVGSPEIEEEMFLTGLLHDISKLILLQQFTDQYQPVLDRYASDPAGHLIIESTTLGFTHADLSAIILDQWGFPERMIAVIHRYAIPDLPYFIRTKHAIEQCDLSLPHMLCFAHELASAAGFGFRDCGEVDVFSLPSTRQLGFDRSTVAELAGNLTITMFEESGFRLLNEG